MNLKKLLLLFSFLIISCSKQLPKVDSFAGSNYNLRSHKNTNLSFPNNFLGKTIVMGFIFTNCPDICPMTTNNMRLIQEHAQKEKLENLHFLSLSFDPETDSPEILRKFANIRELDLSNWTFLTGNKATIDSITRHFGVFAIPNDTTVTKAGEKIVYFVHTDRISLIDKEGNLRKNYLGSSINTKEIIEDIKSIE